MKASKGSPIKGSEQELGSPTKCQRSPSGGKTGSMMKKNNSYQEGNILLKKIPYSETMPIRSSDNSKLPSISLSQNISAHFPRTVVKKVEFNGEDIFKDV